MVALWVNRHKAAVVAVSHDRPLRAKVMPGPIDSLHMCHGILARGNQEGNSKGSGLLGLGM